MRRKSAPPPVGPTPIDAPGRRRLPPLLRQAWYSLNQAFGRRLAPLELTPDQFTVLRWLSEGDPQGMRQSELSALMASDPNTISGVLRRMESALLLERSPHESDRRAYRIRVTRHGRQRYQAARKQAVALQAEVLSVLPERKRDEFLAELEAMAAACAKALHES